MSSKIKTCSSVYETKETNDLEKSVAADLEKPDRKMKDLLDGKQKDNEEQ